MKEKKNYETNKEPKKKKKLGKNYKESDKEQGMRKRLCEKEKSTKTDLSNPLLWAQEL